MLRKSFAVSVISLFIVLTGCGGGGTPGTAPAGTPDITLSASSLTFASTTVGQTSASQTVTVTNSGGGSAIVSGYKLTGDTTNFNQTATTCGATLNAGASCAFTFTFVPQAAGTFSLIITVTDNASNSPQSLTLTGMGTAVPLPSAAFSVTSPYTFPTTAVGMTATSNTDISFSNSGGAALTITSIALTGSSDFTQTNNCPTSLAANNAPCSIVVSYTPATPNVTTTASLTVTDNSGGIAGSTQTLTLSGTSTATVTAPLAGLLPGTLYFPATTINTSAGSLTTTLTNSGNATLTGIALSLTGGAAASAFTISSTTCGSTLAALASCTVSVNFTPTSTGTYLAYLSVADNATGSPQTVTLNGEGDAAPAPQALLTANSISFPNTQANTTSASYSVMLSNPGNATLTGIGISVSGTQSTYFTESTTCGATLAAGANCNISATFSPTAAISYMATVSVASSATTQPQTIALSGSGTTSAISYQMIAFPESDNSATQLYSFISRATSTIDMTMYELQDTIFSGDLVAACARGIKVRVILSSSEKSSNTPAYNQLNTAGANCSAVLSNTAFENTHQKTITIDGALPTAQTAILSLNLQTQYYSTTRDFAMIENDPVDIAAIETTFNQDYAAGTPYGGTQGASDFSYQPPPGDDLIWSPTTAQADMVSIISKATTSLYVENEEMSASVIVTALETACKNGVAVYITMVNDSSYSSEFSGLKSAGCGLYLYADTATGFYVHAKAVVADYGLSTQNAYMGSINYSNASMTENRELGMYVTDPASVALLYNTMKQDYTGSPIY